MATAELAVAVALLPRATAFSAEELAEVPNAREFELVAPAPYPNAVAPSAFACAEVPMATEFVAEAINSFPVSGLEPIAMAFLPPTFAL